jgi:hypothetical protein
MKLLVNAARVYRCTCSERWTKQREGWTVRLRLAAKIYTAGLALGLVPAPLAQAADPAQPTLAAKVQPYIACLNRHSERAFASRARYLSWSAKTGPTGKEKIVYGVYTLYDPADCSRGIEEANKMEPHDAPLEKAGAAFAASLFDLLAVVREANDYYEPGDYKDDKMARGKTLHPKLMAAWDRFAAADADLRPVIERINDQIQLETLDAIEKQEGRKTGYLTLAVMIKAKAVLRAERTGPADGFEIRQAAQALEALDASIKDLETYGLAHPGDKAGSIFLSAARSFLKSGKELMRRVRDKVPYSSGEKMLLSGLGSAWMVEGSPGALTHNYNQLVERFNLSPRI